MMDGQALPSGGCTMTTHRIAVIPGDGIGKEVVPEGIRVLEKHGGKSDWPQESV